MWFFWWWVKREKMKWVQFFLVVVCKNGAVVWCGFVLKRPRCSCNVYPGTKFLYNSTHQRGIFPFRIILPSHSLHHHHHSWWWWWWRRRDDEEKRTRQSMVTVRRTHVEMYQSFYFKKLSDVRQNKCSISGKCRNSQRTNRDLAPCSTQDGVVRTLLLTIKKN